MGKEITQRLKIYINGNEVDATLANLRKSLSQFRAQSNRAVEGTPEWRKYNEEVARLEGELHQATAAQKKFREETGLGVKTMEKAKAGFSSLFPNISGAILFTDAIKGAINFAKEFIGNSVEMAVQAKGVEFAFERLGQKGEDAFEKVKKATRGLLSDLEIKRSLVEFDNFNISLEESATLFEFLSVRATQTGQSVDYLKQSMVEGLSKESKLRIDNLGISTSKLNEELEKTPNFVQAVANIAKTEIARAGNILDEAASSSQKWNATLENTQLKLGNLINNSGVIPFFQKLGTSILNTVAPMEKASAATDAERMSLFLVESKIKDVNTSNEERLRLINQLKEKYPTLLKDINAEKVSNEELTIALRRVNDELVNKIILQDKDSDIADQNAKVAKEKIKLFEKEDEVRQRMIKLAEKHNITLKDNATLQEQARAVITKLGISGGVLVDPVAKLSHELNNLSIIQKNVNHEDAKSNLLLDEKKGLFDRLNVSQDVLNTGNKTASDNVDLSKQVKLLSEINAEIAAKSALLDGTSNNAQYKKIQDEIALLEKQKAAITGGSATSGTKSKTAKTDDPAITPEDQKIIDSKKKVAEFLAQWQADQDIQNQIKDLEKDEAAQLKEELEIEAKYNKLEEQAANDTALLVGLKEAEQAELDEVSRKWNDKFWNDNKKNKAKIAADDKKYKEEVLNAEKELQQAKSDMLFVGLDILKSFVKEGSAEYKALFAMEKIAAAVEVILAGQRERAGYMANPTWTAMLDGGATIKATAVLASKIRTGISLATIAATAIKGFDKGGFTGDGPSSGGVDGIGGQFARFHPGEYVVPRPVMKMPEVPYIIEYLEAKRTGKTAEATSNTVQNNGASNEINAMTVSVLNKLNQHLESGLKLNYTLDDERDRQLFQKKLDNTINASKK
jgi:hypothetical protein